MNVEAISALAPTDEVPDSIAPPAAARDAGGVSFSELVNAGLAHVNGQLLASQVDLQKLALGEAPNLHEVLIRLEESRMGFQLLMQVRGRVLEAYQEVMRMQI